MCVEQPSGRATLGTCRKYLKTRMVCTSPHSHFCRKALPDGDSGQEAVIDAHQCRSSPNRLHDPTSGTIRSSRRRFRRRCQDTRQRRYRWFNAEDLNHRPLSYEPSTLSLIWRNLTPVLGRKYLPIGPNFGPLHETIRCFGFKVVSAAILLCLFSIARPSSLLPR
jgi:hypothetical protein